MRNILLDTGPLVALLDRSESKHAVCAEYFKSYRGNLVTSEPVITEALHLLNQSVIFQKTCVEFLLAAKVEWAPSTPEILTRAIALMEKYKNVPMDFADATLVLIAEDSGCHDIFTLDRRGFETFRTHGKKYFTIYP